MDTLSTHIMIVDMATSSPGKPGPLLCGRCGASESEASEKTCQEVLPGA
jgi:hypothetical protein